MKRLQKHHWRLNLGVLVAMFAFVMLTSCAGSPIAQGEASPQDQRVKEALALIGQGEHDQGEERLIALTLERPLVVEAHRELQRLRLARFEHMSVLRDYQQLVDDLPRSGSAHYLLGRLLHRLEDQKVLFESSVILDEKNPWGYQGLAWNAVARGQFEEALRQLNLALAAQPGHARSRYLLVRLLLAQGRVDQARSVLTLLLDQHPDDASFWILRAQLGNREGIYEDTLDALARALTLEPADPEARDLLLDLIRVTHGRAIAFLATDLGEGLIDSHATDLRDIEFLARLKSLGDDPLIAQEQAMRALAAGSISKSILLAARPMVREYFQSWKRIYETDRLNLSQPIIELEAALDGPSSSGHSAGDLQIADACLSAGFLDLASHILNRLSLRETGSGAKSEELQDLTLRFRKHKRVLARIQVLIDRIQAKPQSDLAESLEVFLAEVARLIQEETGYVCDQPEPILGVPLVGSAIDSSKANDGTINGYMRRFNQVMFCGRLDGAATQAVIMTIVSGPNRIVPEQWPTTQGCVEFIGGMVAVRSQDESFGDSAGRALFGTYFVDLDVLIPWKEKLAQIAKESPEVQSTIMANRALDANGSAERLSMAYPGIIAEALTLTGFGLHNDLLVLDAVQVHEQGHLRDSFNYLPLWQSVFPNLFLLFRGGFTSKGVMAELEDTAAHHALRFAKSPHIVLAELVRSLPTGNLAGPHARGYKNLLARFLIYLDAHVVDFEQISANHVLMHQLHLLTEAQIRFIANEI